MNTIKLSTQPSSCMHQSSFLSTVVKFCWDRSVHQATKLHSPIFRAGPFHIDIC